MSKPKDRVILVGVGCCIIEIEDVIVLILSLSQRSDMLG